MIDFSSESTGPAVPASLRDSVTLLAKKWHPAIIRSLAESDGLGYSDLESRLDGVSAKVLSDALSELQESKIIERTELSTQPLRVRYTLTDRGAELDGVIRSLAAWGETYLADDAEKVVLIADDDTRVSSMHRAWLEREYTVRTARDGKETLNELDTEVDVVVLDRRMPGLSGDEVLNWIRSQRYECRVVMVTAEEPDVDVLEMDFDAYLTKPVLKDELRSVVADLLERVDHDREVRECLALRSKLALVEAAESEATLAASDEYGRYRERLDALEADLEDLPEAAASTLDRLATEGRR